MGNIHTVGPNEALIVSGKRNSKQFDVLLKIPVDDENVFLQIRTCFF